jgi:hypothetical protein
VDVVAGASQSHRPAKQLFSTKVCRTGVIMGDVFDFFGMRQPKNWFLFASECDFTWLRFRL